jgi:hypothetical protein
LIDDKLLQLCKCPRCGHKEVVALAALGFGQSNQFDEKTFDSVIRCKRSAKALAKMLECNKEDGKSIKIVDISLFE